MIAPTVYLFDENVRLIGHIHRYTSLRFCRAWRSVGERFELRVADYAALLPLLERARYICLDGDGRRCGCIRGVRYVDTLQSELVLTGYPLKWYARTRINKQPDDAALAALNFGYDAVPLAESDDDPQIPLPAETVLKTYAQRHMTAPADSKRRIPCLQTAEDQGRGKALRWLAENGMPLDETLESVCGYADIGYDIRLDIANERMVFDIVPGVDRSRSQSARPPVVFSVEHRNLSSAEYYTDDEDHRNVVYAKSAEQTDGVSVLPAYTDEEEMPSGLSRREMFSDQSSHSLAETATKLSAETTALQELSERRKTEELTGAVIAMGTFEYLRDWDVGDLVSIDLSIFGKTVDQRIVTVTEEYESGHYTVTPGFKTEETTRVKLIRRLKHITIGG